MGCDIHPIVQWLEYPKNERRADDHWTSLSRAPMDWGRDYDLFSRMAGVRCGCGDAHPYGVNCPIAVAQPRGYPPEFADPDDSDLHTPSWLTLDELKRAAGDGSYADVYATIAAMEEFERRGFKTRLVFAFDN